MNFDIILDDELCYRITLGNLFVAPKSTEFSLSLPIMLRQERWTVICLDLVEISKMYFSRMYSQMKSLQLCSTIFVGGIFTSDNKYTPQTLPFEFLLRVPEKKSFHDVYEWISFPSCLIIMSDETSDSDCEALCDCQIPFACGRGSSKSSLHNEHTVSSSSIKFHSLSEQVDDFCLQQYPPSLPRYASDTTSTFCPVPQRSSSTCGICSFDEHSILPKSSGCVQSSSLCFDRESPSVEDRKSETDEHREQKKVTFETHLSSSKSATATELNSHRFQSESKQLLRTKKASGTLKKKKARKNVSKHSVSSAPNGIKHNVRPSQKRVIVQQKRSIKITTISSHSSAKSHHLPTSRGKLSGQNKSNSKSKIFSKSEKM
eukprot:MONOS_10580.1-p1 / transcript=MONOS_10580.1 / gene=MONOS_10580 / organism=Monocercomonoides_exilis_PA203 / gene_product=unspecified product / transcript_product=unspecified product / location=Mono_scaffold00486:28719-29985(-) / protein_length=373 / sequence_SO=supercontig / SO=protein_coding / is_pseudo=false